MKILTTLLALLFLAGAAWADEVFLKSGGRLEGIARQDGDRVVVEMKAGTVTLRATDVAEIVNGETPLHAYQQRFARVQANPSASAYFELALWAKSNGLSRYVTALLERVVALDPEHAAARKLLGQVFHGGRWVTESERQAALGFVQFRGRWVLTTERNRVLAAEEARQAEERAAALRRTKERARSIEATPYALGIRVYPNRGSQVWSGGYPFWGSAWYHHGPRGFIHSLIPIFGSSRGTHPSKGQERRPAQSGAHGHQGSR